jgi:pyruvate kinase
VRKTKIICTLGPATEQAEAILLDTQGPAIRTGEIDSKLPLRAGDVLEFTVRGAKPKETNSVSVNYDAFIDNVSWATRCWLITV